LSCGLAMCNQKEAVFSFLRDVVGISQAQKPTLSLIDRVLLIKTPKSSSSRKRS